MEIYIVESSFMYVSHDLFKQQIHFMPLTLQMILFAGNQGPENLVTCPKTRF